MRLPLLAVFVSALPSVASAASASNPLARVIAQQGSGYRAKGQPAARPSRQLR